MKPSRFDNIWIKERGRKVNLVTENLVPGKRVYGEKLFKDKGKEYREWDPNRSKLGAAITKGISQIGIRQGYKVLYLGAASGTTVSHVSDVVKDEGFIFAIDFAPRVLRDLYFIALDRKNIAPIMADCNHPERYEDIVPEVDVVFQDVAQRNQVEIFLKNLKFLKKGGFGLLALKARSVDVTKNPRDIFKIVRQQLEKSVTVVDYRELEPFEKDHALFVVKK